MTDDARTIDINGRTYNWPRQPVVVVCMDGSEPGYVEAAVETGKAPFFARMLTEGTNRLADCVIPSFTTPNNLSIVTGVPPAIHGIAGNYFYDQDADEDVMTNKPKYLWVDTIFKAVFDAGGKVAVVMGANPRLARPGQRKRDVSAGPSMRPLPRSRRQAARPWPATTRWPSSSRRERS